MESLGSSIYLTDSNENVENASRKLNRTTVAELNLLLRSQSRDRVENEREALRLLDELFESLTTQACSPLEQSFYSELNQLCSMRLGRECDFKLRLNESEMTSWEQNRIAFTTTLSRFWITLIKFVTITKRRLLHKRVQLGFRGRSQLTVDSGLTIFLTTAVLQRAFRHSGVLDSLGTSFSTKIKVIGAALEISAVGSTWWRSSIDDCGGVETDYGHFDEAIERPKAIVYLSDVGPDSGPTEYFPGLFETLKLTPLQELVSRVVLNVGADPKSALHPHTRGFRMRSAAPMFRYLFSQLPVEMRFNSHFGWDVPSTHPLRREFSNRRTQVIGDAGTTLVFDGGRVVHRGGLIRDGERLVLQVVFGLDRGSFQKSVLSWLKKH